MLPNRQIFLVMSPREASMLADQILDPAEFPWMDSEALMVGQETRVGLRYAVEHMGERELQVMAQALLAPDQQPQEEEEDTGPDQILGQQRDGSVAAPADQLDPEGLPFPGHPINRRRD